MVSPELMPEKHLVLCETNRHVGGHSESLLCTGEALNI